MMMISRRSMVLGLAASALGMPGTGNAATRVLGGYAFGSTWRVVTDNGPDPALIRSTVQTVIDQTNREMSPFDPASDLSRFNSSEKLEIHDMPSGLCDVTERSLAIAERTQGAFDPTVGPIVRRYGFGPIKGASGSFRDIAVHGNTIRKTDPSLTLDLCGIAKGHALDQIVTQLSAIGVVHALVELGGEVMTLGLHPDERPWQVAIADPFAQTFTPLTLVVPHQYALATSGHAANGVYGPIATSHIINPEKMRPATTTLASVSVLAETALEADAYATALCAAGAEKGIALAQQLGLAALFVTDRANNTAYVTTGHFPEHLLL